MDKLEIIERIANGEDSYTQFKLDASNSDQLAQEFVAFSNARGGVLIIGIDDSKTIIGLDDQDIRRLNQLIGNVINSNVVPPIYPLVKTEDINTKKILIIEIGEGINKPYSTNKGVYFTKAGSDKRKISPQELRRLFAESKNLYADEESLKDSDIHNFNTELFYKFLEKDNPRILRDVQSNISDLELVLNNYNLMNQNELTLAGHLIFGINIKTFTPSFYIDCCYFIGNDISSKNYRSEKRLYGTFEYLFENSLGFITSQLRSIQVEENFNSNGMLEISQEVLTELIINALVHRDYYIQSSIKIFMFDDRVEIISPGKLTNSLTVEKIKNGISIHRNPILDSIVKNILPYSGRGSGIKRAISINPDIEFINDIDKEEFKCIICRNKLGENSNKLGENSNKLGENSNKLGENSNKLGGNSNKLGGNREKILRLLQENSKVTIPILSQKIGITTTAIEKNLKYLKENAFIKRVGSAKGGHWEIF